jgi:hypothetical protein
VKKVVVFDLAASFATLSMAAPPSSERLAAGHRQEKRR